MNARLFEDIGFYAVAEAHSHQVDFKVYEVEGLESPNKPLFHKKDADTYPDPVESIDDAEVYLHGAVKWDGCSNWHFDEQDRVMLHACDRSKLLAFGDVMAKCWDWAKEIMPNFDQ